MNCKTCKFFVPERRHRTASLNVDGYGSCTRWNTGYGYDVDEMPSNEVLVENDEGWAMVVGPDFGCVLWEVIGSRETEDE